MSGKPLGVSDVRAHAQGASPRQRCPVGMTSGSARRSYGIDLLRGVACTSVVVFHYLSRAPREGWMKDVPLRAFEPVARYGYLGVHLFFMVSGYVIFMSAIDRTPRAFVASRVARLYPALWVAASITMCLAHWFGDSRFMVSVPDYLWNLTLVPQYVSARFVDGAYWSLAVELQFYILIWITLRASLMARVEWLMAAWLVLSMVNAIRPVYPIERWLIAQWAPLFVLGATTFLVSAYGWSASRCALLAAAGVLSLWNAALEAQRLGREWHGTGPSTLIVCATLISAGASFMAVGLGRVVVRKSRWASTPGMLTYPVYLIHQIAGYIIYAAVLRATASPAFGLAAALIFSAAIGAAIHFGAEKSLGPRLRRLVGGAQPLSK